MNEEKKTLLKTDLATYLNALNDLSIIIGTYARRFSDKDVDVIKAMELVNTAIVSTKRAIQSIERADMPKIMNDGKTLIIHMRGLTQRYIYKISKSRSCV